MPVDIARSGATRKPAQPEIWTCPSCGVENTSIFTLGCPACGAGKPGQPIVQPPTPALTVESAFFEWIHPLRGRVDAAQETLLFEAFKAGWEMIQGKHATPPTLPQTNDLHPKEVLVGTRESRTLKAALQLFIDQILSTRPEEIAAGEWLSADEARVYLSTL